MAVFTRNGIDLESPPEEFLVSMNCAKEDVRFLKKALLREFREITISTS